MSNIATRGSGSDTPEPDKPEDVREPETPGRPDEPHMTEPAYGQPTLDREVLRRTERWFIRQGVPRFIEAYDSRTHVLPRMLPFMLAMVLWALDPLEKFVADTTISMIVWTCELVLIYGVWGWVYHRSPRAWRVLPSRGNWTVTVVALVVVPFVAVMIIGSDEFAAVRKDAGLFSIIIMMILVGLLLTLWLTYLITSYGLVPLTRRIFIQILRDLARSLPLQARALPVLLLATVFLFFTGELWQAAYHLSGSKVGILIGVFALLCTLVIASGVREESSRIQRSLTPDQVVAESAGTPLADHAPLLAAEARAVPLRRRQEANMLMVLGARQLIQATVVGLGIFVFFAGIGLLILDNGLVTTWVGETPDGVLLDRERLDIAIGPVEWTTMAYTWKVTMVKVATVLASFSAFSFVVTTVSDAAYRQQFFAPAVRELERWLAVRAAYQVLHARSGSSGRR